MRELLFTVLGEPVGKERARVVQKPGTKPRGVTPAKTRAWEARVRYVAQAAASRQKWRPNDSYRYGIELGVMRTHEDRGPDLDNVVKGVLDALNGVAWKDDAHVRIIVAAMMKSETEPGVVVKIWRLP